MKRLLSTLFVVALALPACTDHENPVAFEPSIASLDVAASATSEVPVDLSDWTAESYPGSTSGNWNVSSDGTSVLQTVNGDPMVFYGDFEAFKTEVQGIIRVHPDWDDDYIGFVLGFQPGDTENANADYLLVDWKKGEQFFDFGSPSCTPGSTAREGLAVSRVFGIPTADELWGHENFDESCSDTNNGVEELARANTLGSTGWQFETDYTFSFQFTATLLRVFVDGELELEIEDEFNNGRLGFYNFSQAQVEYSAFTVAEFNNAPAAEDDEYDVDEDEELDVNVSEGLLDNDSDPDADNLTAVPVDEPENGTLTLNADGSFTYTPDADYHGSDEFTYSASDGDLTSDPATVSITINSVDDAPVADGGGPYQADEGSDITFDASSSIDVDGDPLTYEWDFGDGNSANTVTPTHTYADDGEYTVTLTVSDGALDDEVIVTATIDNVAPDVDAVSVPADPVELGTSVTVSASFEDPGINDGSFSAMIDWGDGTTATADVIESGGSGTAEGSHTYAEDGMYMVTIEVTDKDGTTGTSDPTDIVVYNPNASVSGRGTINSPAGAYLYDESLSGEARLGFVSRYRKGATVPTGRTDFVFRVADFRFVSMEYESLVVAGPRAQFKGSGAINREGDYGFMLTGIDGDQPGGNGVDRFRIKIWDKVTEEVIYDNEHGTDDEGDPTTTLTRGRIIIRK